MAIDRAERGRQALDERIANRPSVRAAVDYLEPLERLWDAGLPPGYKTGWASVDAHYTVAPGQLTIITGWPGAGKSEWLDAVLINLSRQGWSHSVFSAENQPTELHISKLVEKLSRRPFGDGPSARIAKEDLRKYCAELKSFGFISAKADSLSLNAIIEAAAEWLEDKTGPRGLVIDPWNELEHWRGAGVSETEYISRSLSTLRNWARANQTHVWLVAHPAKQPRENGKLPVPTPDMISGSQHFWNKADACITVYRDPSDLESRETHIYVQKVRFKHVGKPGLVTLRYNRVDGNYSEITKQNLYAVKDD